MARQIDIIATETGTHYLLFGMNENEISNFSIQLWITKYGKRGVDWMERLGLGFVSFMGGELWVHNSDEVGRCNLFGEQKDCIVGIVANEQANVIKLFDSVGIHTDGEWEITDITIPATLNYPDGMYSKLPTGKFQKRDGVLRAEFLRNMKSGSSTASVVNALSGEQLRGHEGYMLLKNTSTAEVRLFKIDVNFTKSRI